MPVIRPATETDMPAVWALYSDACDVMLGTPYDCEWVMGVHPTREGLLASVRAGNLFVACESDGAAAEGGATSPLLGAYVLNDEQTSGYEHAAWPVDAGPEEVAVIHLLVSAVQARGRGVARSMLAHATGVARARGACVIRLDVFTNNTPALSLYSSAGFVDIGPYELLLSEGHHRTLNLMELDLRE